MADQRLSRHSGDGLDELDPDHQREPACGMPRRLPRAGVARVTFGWIRSDLANSGTSPAERRSGASAARHRRGRERRGLAIEINTVALRDINEDEIEQLDSPVMAKASI